MVEATEEEVAEAEVTEAASEAEEEIVADLEVDSEATEVVSEEEEAIVVDLEVDSEVIEAVSEEEEIVVDLEAEVDPEGFNPIN